MLQPRIASRDASITSLATALNTIALCPRHASRSRPQLIFTQTRNASHAAQGRANGPKDSAGRRLGAKKTASEWVIPGNIIFKQRGKNCPHAYTSCSVLHLQHILTNDSHADTSLTGTKWYPGENVGIGKDHTIYSKIHGYVRYYRNPSLHPKRRYIGVALAKEGPAAKLPTPPNAITRRRLGMYLSPIKDIVLGGLLTPEQQAAKDSAFMTAHMSASSKGSSATAPMTVPTPPQAAVQGKPVSKSPFDPVYATRKGGHGMANYEIGRAAERAGITVREFDRKDRWKAWRVRAKKVKEKMIARAERASRKSKGAKSNKVQKKALTN